MEFRDNEAIYLQIAELVGANILSGKWKAEDKIPSVRDMAIDLQVNLNTVMHAYEYLDTLGVIYNKRGIGSFVTPKGREKSMNLRKDKFLKQDLNQFFSTLYLLDISMQEIDARYEQFKVRMEKSKNKRNEKE